MEVPFRIPAGLPFTTPYTAGLSMLRKHRGFLLRGVDGPFSPR
jgi:hypothetical protein